MPSNIFEAPRKGKDIVIILQNSSNSSINFVYTSTHDIYIVNNFIIFKQYISKLLNRAGSRIMVISIFTDFKGFLPTMKFLKSFDNDKRRYQQEEFIRQYKFYLRQIQQEQQNDDLNLEVTLMPGQCDHPLAFELIIILDSNVMKPDHLSTNSISIQQFLRTIALKHGGSLIGTPSIEVVKDNPELLFKLDKNPKPIYDNTEFHNEDELLVNLFIPKGWDSWSKIKLLAKSIVYDNQSKLLIKDSEFNEFNLLYNRYMNSNENLDNFLSFILD